MKVKGEKAYSMNDSSSFSGKIEALVKSTISALGFIPACFESASMELKSSVIDAFEVESPRFNFLRKFAESASVAEKTKVCLFFICKFSTVSQLDVGFAVGLSELLDRGTISMIDCTSLK